MATNSFKHYTKTCYYGTTLLKKHNLNEYGIWRVEGEDPNCDMGGHHIMPLLGVFEGYLLDIISMAVEMPQFWTWGGGGKITKVNIEKISPDTAKVRQEQRERLEELEKEASILRKNLGL